MMQSPIASSATFSTPRLSPLSVNGQSATDSLAVAKAEAVSAQQRLLAMYGNAHSHALAFLASLSQSHAKAVAAAGRDTAKVIEAHRAHVERCAGLLKLTPKLFVVEVLAWLEAATRQNAANAPKPPPLPPTDAEIDAHLRSTIDNLVSAGVTVVRVGDTLEFSPASKLTPETVRTLRAYRDRMVAIIRAEDDCVAI